MQRGAAIRPAFRIPGGSEAPLVVPVRDFERPLPAIQTDAGRDAGWRARLELEIGLRAGRSRLTRAVHYGPLRVQRLFHPEPGVRAHAYLLHPPGGIVGGDRLEIEIGVQGGAAALVTTPGATKLYRSAGPESEQRFALRAAAGACLEWLPQESIVFDGARARSHTRVELEPGAQFAGWEVHCLGRPGAGERFAQGHWLAQLELWRGAHPLLLERLDARADAPLLSSPWGLGGAPVTATLACTLPEGDAPARALGEALRAALEGGRRQDEWLATSALDGVQLCRYLGPSAARARTALARAWALWREASGQGRAVPPRIWST